MLACRKVLPWWIFVWGRRHANPSMLAGWLTLAWRSLIRTTALQRSCLLALCMQVPKGHVWLQGDNLLHSRDSREYGPIPLALIKGRVMYQVHLSWSLSTAFVLSIFCHGSTWGWFFILYIMALVEDGAPSLLIGNAALTGLIAVIQDLMCPMPPHRSGQP